MTPSFDPGSFKDPDGRVFHHEGQVCRTVVGQRLDELKGIQSAPWFERLVADGLVLPFEVVETASLQLDPRQFGAAVLRQRKIPFVSYPAEWSFEMLRQAALVTLTIARRSLESGYVLKDATPYNIVFEGRVPRFVDILSFQRVRHGEPWLAYGQFCRLFLYPLLIAAHRRIDVRSWLSQETEGVTPSLARRFFTWRDALRPGVGKDVFLAAWFDGTSAGKVAAAQRQQVFSQAMVIGNIRRLEGIIRALPSPYRRMGAWAGYAVTQSYSSADLQEKAEITDRVLTAARPSRVLDIGCNTGAYARLATKHCGSLVMAMDADQEVIDRLYGSLVQDDRIYPCVANLAAPTPAMGWALSERRSLLERVRCDAFLALAVLHHLRITANVPFELILTQLAGLGRRGLIEWIDPDDEMVQELLALRQCSYDDFNFDTFMERLAVRFETLAVLPIKGGKRKLIVVEARQGAGGLDARC